MLFIALEIWNCMCRCILTYLLTWKFVMISRVLFHLPIWPRLFHNSISVRPCFLRSFSILSNELPIWISYLNHHDIVMTMLTLEININLNVQINICIWSLFKPAKLSTGFLGLVLLSFFQQVSPSGRFLFFTLSLFLPLTLS